MFVWGYGILGFGPNVQKAENPTEIPQTLFGQNMYLTNSKVISIASGLYHMAGITNYGHLYMWGHNKGGCLGFGHVKPQFFPLKVRDFLCFYNGFLISFLGWHPFVLITFRIDEINYMPLD